MKYKLYELHYAEYREQIETNVEESVLATASMYAKHYNKPVDIWFCDINTSLITKLFACIKPNGERTDKPFYECNK